MNNGNKGNASSPFQGRTMPYQWTPPNNTSTGGMNVSPSFTTDSSGKLTGTGANATAFNQNSFVSMGGYQPTGGSTQYSISGGTNLNSSTSIFGGASGNKDHVNAGVGIKKKF